MYVGNFLQGGKISCDVLILNCWPLCTFPMCLSFPLPLPFSNEIWGLSTISVHLLVSVSRMFSSFSLLCCRGRRHYLQCINPHLWGFVWPTCSQLSVTGKKPFCLYIFKYHINDLLCSSWLHPFWVEDETWQLLVIRGASVSSYFSLNIHAINNCRCLYKSLYF